MSHKPKEVVELRRGDNGERFVAFAFAAADMVAEVDPAGLITYAAGAYRSKFGDLPEAWVGRRLHDMVAPADHDALTMALAMLEERGRMQPWTLRLANSQRTEVALAGLRLAPNGRPTRMCVTFALPPSPLASPSRATMSQAFARAAEGRIQAKAPPELGLLEVEGCDADVLGSALAALAPDALASELAPGRIGLLGPDGGGLDLMKVAASLEALLGAQGVAARVSSRSIALDCKTLTPRQVALALRQALGAFARGGMPELQAGGFEGGLTGYVHGALKHAGAMRRAIQERRFTLVYQPIISLTTLAVHHYEALLRPEPVRGCPTQTTQEFVVLAEAIGLAGEVDLAVASIACDAAVGSAVPVAFNLSTQSMQDPVIRDRLIADLSKHPACQARKLMVEMTETAQLDDLAEATRTAQRLRELDVPFCLDDFGAGAADMRVLRAMPVNFVKLDGSYLAGIMEDGRERAFVAGMIEIARAAGAAVVGERVETEAEAQALRSLGVDYGQGWLFGRPGALPVSASVSPSRLRGDQKDTWR